MKFSIISTTLTLKRLGAVFTSNYGTKQRNFKRMVRMIESRFLSSVFCIGKLAIWIVHSLQLYDFHVILICRVLWITRNAPVWGKSPFFQKYDGFQDLILSLWLKLSYFGSEDIYSTTLIRYKNVSVLHICENLELCKMS